MWIHRKAQDRRLESALRRQRAEPREGFVANLAGGLDVKGTPRRVGSRLAFAAAMSTFILGTFASFGGFGYAASGATSTYHVVKKVVADHKLAVTVHKSSADDEYPNNPTPPKENVAAGAENAAPAGVATAEQSQALPFTGISLAVTVAIGLTLIIIGLMLRRRENRE